MSVKRIAQWKVQAVRDALHHHDDDALRRFALSGYVIYNPETWEWSLNPEWAEAIAAAEAGVERAKRKASARGRARRMVMKEMFGPSARWGGGKTRRPHGLVGLLATRPAVPPDPHWLHDVIRAEFTWHGKPMVAVKHKGGPAELYVVDAGLESFAGYCAPSVTQGLCGAVNNYFKKKALGYREDDFRKRPGFSVTAYQGPGIPLGASPGGKRRSTSFAKLTRKLAARGAADPKALAASIGRKQIGQDEMTRRAVKAKAKKRRGGKKRHVPSFAALVRRARARIRARKRR